MKNLVKGMILATALMAAVVVPANTSEAKVKVSKVTVKSNYGTNVHVAVGKKIKLTTTVKVKPNKAANKKVTYYTSNKKIATVSSSGYVKGIKTGSCTITVRSKKNPKKKASVKVYVVKKVTSIKLTSTEKEIYAGSKLTLTKTVLPSSGSYKKLTFTSSNKKVATVTNSGVVTGVAAGTATITAKSVEGTGKSATYKVKVLSADTINLQAVDVRANDCVHVTLNKVKTLTASQFNVMGKRYSFGKYNRTYTVRKIRNYDNKNYDVFLNTDNLIEEDSFVQVTIAALPGNGTKVKEAQAISVSTLAPQDQRWVGVVGDRVEKIIDLSAYCYGTINYQVSGGIVGVTYKQKGNKLVFSGSYGVSGLDGKIDVTATDELGNVVKQRIYVAVGNSKTIAALSTTKVILSGLDVETGAIVEAAGASGAYNYSAGSLPEGLKMNSNGVISGKTTKVGEYNISVNIVDQTDTSLKTTVTVKLIIEASKKFYGIVKDQNGKVVEGVKVRFYNKEYATTYETTTNAGGYYSMDVPAGTYTIRAEYYDGEKLESYDAVYDVTMTTGARQYDFDVTVETKDK